MNYSILHSRKKGLQKKDDLKKRNKFALKVSKMLIGNSGKKIFYSKLMLLGFSISTLSWHGPYKL